MNIDIFKRKDGSIAAILIEGFQPANNAGLVFDNPCNEITNADYIEYKSKLRNQIIDGPCTGIQIAVMPNDTICEESFEDIFGEDCLPEKLSGNGPASITVQKD